MRITAIEPRRKGLSAVYIDGEFAMKLDTQTLLDEYIKIRAVALFLQQPLFTSMQLVSKYIFANM